jgi:hypothetical protein
METKIRKHLLIIDYIHSIIPFSIHKTKTKNESNLIVKRMLLSLLKYIYMKLANVSTLSYNT